MNIKNIIFFAAGLTIGATASYFMTKEALAARQQQEISEMRDYYARQYGAKPPKEETPNDELVTSKDSLDTKQQIDMAINDYHTESTVIDDGKRAPITSVMAKPYIISDEEFETSTKYAKYSYVWYYGVKVMIDKTDGEEAVVEDPVYRIGADNLTELEESADGYIYVRNDNVGEDYEVILANGEPDINPDIWEPNIAVFDDEDD